MSGLSSKKAVLLAFAAPVYIALVAGVAGYAKSIGGNPLLISIPAGLFLVPALTFIFLLMFGDELGEKKAKVKASKFIESYVFGSGVHVSNTRKVLKRNHVIRSTVDEESLGWAEQNFDVRKLSGFYMVGMHEKYDSFVHEHHRLKFVGVNFLWATYWFEVPVVCEKRNAYLVRHTATVRESGFWSSMQRMDSGEVFYGMNKSSPLNFGTILFDVPYIFHDSNATSQQPHEFLSVATCFNQARSAFETTEADYHEYFFHHDKFGVGTDFEGVPLSYVTKMMKVVPADIFEGMSVGSN